MTRSEFGQEEKGAPKQGEHANATWTWRDGMIRTRNLEQGGNNVIHHINRNAYKECLRRAYSHWHAARPYYILHKLKIRLKINCEEYWQRLQSV